MPALALVPFNGGVKDPVTISDDAVQASVLAGAFHAAMFLVVAATFLVFGLPRAAGAAALLGVLMWAASLLQWAVVWAIARVMRRRRARPHSAMYHRPSTFSSTYWS